MDYVAARRQPKDDLERCYDVDDNCVTLTTLCILPLLLLSYLTAARRVGPEAARLGSALT